MEEGFLDLEEVEGVEVVYEGADGALEGGAKVVKFRVREREEREEEEVIDVDVNELDLDVDMEGEDGDGDEDEEGEYDLPPDEEELLITGPELPDSKEDKDMDVVEEGPDNLDEENEVEEVKQVDAFDGMSLCSVPSLFLSFPFFRARAGAILRWWYGMYSIE